MIKSFADENTRLIFGETYVRGLDKNLQKQALRRLRYIHAAAEVKDLQIPPSNKLEKKEGDLKDFYAIWVNRQYRIIFRFEKGDAYDVALVDYH